ncbi:unnamed protein product [Oncorhynchus mykiss]|uniref:Uncharacterized protein n=1 Tax=Oncorhynchus mykiss TaxID=8022 RepID=A0A060YX33_ONCMY|nr:unnamed protein product [Oncorhynchus mykiss]
MYLSLCVSLQTLASTKTLRQIIEEANSLLRMFWRAALHSCEGTLRAPWSETHTPYNAFICMTYRDNGSLFVFVCKSYIKGNCFRVLACYVCEVTDHCLEFVCFSGDFVNTCHVTPGAIREGSHSLLFTGVCRCLKCDGVFFDYLCVSRSCL